MNACSSIIVEDSCINIDYVRRQVFGIVSNEDEFFTLVFQKCIGLI